MFRYLRFYILPAAIMLVAFSMLFGGVWLWLPGVSLVLLVSALDNLVPKDLDEKKYKYPFFLDLALYMSTPASLAIFFALFWVAGSGSQDVFGVGGLIQSMTNVDVVDLRNNTPWYHYVLMVFALAMPVTGAGGLAGHELTHRTWRPFDLWLGRFTMALNWGIAFPIEHVYGHHSYVGTAKDPATAARGDSVYQHLPKAMYLTVLNAWEIESSRLDKIGASVLSPKNVLLQLASIAMATTVVAYLCAGWVGVMFHLTICLMTKIALEILNYVEHYGIVRVPTEPVKPHHSWNCNHLVSGVFTYNLTRHSHHHADAQVPFQDLQSYHDQPEMPGGFMTAYLTTLIPPLWQKRITPKLNEWDEKFASAAERDLARKANKVSHWSGLNRRTLA
ncbi:alkane 1-monooxygenase [Zhongshania sp.]|jgi:alkane 1-monooxygenase|uniref:alkane 1-monooxygenase n=1 Tax=Zhongshania sp. TaxID=1971902 RepID=UPI002A80A51E|nr:alkane 1-monooxygenase [Zhongshania sp.]